MYNDNMRNNPLITYADMKKALLSLIEPYRPFLSPGNARITLNYPGTTFSTAAVHVEGFARILWGLIPYLAGGNKYHNVDNILTGLSNGVNPDHEEFWGWPGDYDQLLVEMAVFGYALCFIPEILWEPLDKKTKKNFAVWLSYINKQKIPDCNWVFFRILVNCGLLKVGADEVDKQALDSSLELVERFYVGDGWYNDGLPDERNARDYYISFAIHYYSLIFSRVCADLYPKQAAIYKERAGLFARDFLYWFSEDGSALPFGRSLTYRFAQCSFWGGLVFAGLNPLPWGKIKGLITRHLRWWFSKPVFSETGLLRVGYTYPNLRMAERYNSYNSPLWALKAFIPLAVPENHPFWQAKEEKLEKKEEEYLQKHTGFIICDSKETGHLYVLNAGQWTPGMSNEHNHMAEKYAKFAYSNYFGFNVVTDAYGTDKLANDNMLLIGKGDSFYRYRRNTHDHIITKEYVYSEWSPCKGIMIKTYLVPAGAWSLRFHHITSDMEFESSEGGFALPYDDHFYRDSEKTIRENPNECFILTTLGSSGIKNIISKRDGYVIKANPNSNIMHPRTFIPALAGTYPPGEIWTGCAVMAHPDPSEGERIWEKGLDLDRLIKKLPKELQAVCNKI